jgi:integral membrane protein (TIGR01906 family)
MKAKLAVILAVISLTLVFFLGNFYIAAHRLSFTNPEAQNVVDYVNGRSALTAAFSDAEAAHLADVRALFADFFVALYIVLPLSVVMLFLVIFLGKKQAIIGALNYSALVTILLSAVIFILAANFSSFFTSFHGLFFPQGNWAFPQGSKLIALFPESFFQFMLGKIVFNAFIQALTLFALIFPHTPVFAWMKRKIPAAEVKNS